MGEPSKMPPGPNSVDENTYRFASLMSSIVTRKVDVHLKNKVVAQGFFHSLSFQLNKDKRDMSLALRYAQELPNESSQSISGCLHKYMIVPGDLYSSFSAYDVPVTLDEMKHTESIYGLNRERSKLAFKTCPETVKAMNNIDQLQELQELQEWRDDESDSKGIIEGLGTKLEPWNQFDLNTKRFGASGANFDFSDYTTELDTSTFSQDTIEKVNQKVISIEEGQRKRGVYGIAEDDEEFFEKGTEKVAFSISVESVSKNDIPNNLVNQKNRVQVGEMGMHSPQYGNSVQEDNLNDFKKADNFQGFLKMSDTSFDGIKSSDKTEFSINSLNLEPASQHKIDIGHTPNVGSDYTSEERKRIRKLSFETSSNEIGTRMQQHKKLLSSPTGKVGVNEHELNTHAQKNAENSKNLWRVASPCKSIGVQGPLDLDTSNSGPKSSFQFNVNASEFKPRGIYPNVESDAESTKFLNSSNATTQETDTTPSNLAGTNNDKQTSPFLSVDKEQFDVEKPVVSGASQPVELSIPLKADQQKAHTDSITVVQKTPERRTLHEFVESALGQIKNESPLQCLCEWEHRGTMSYQDISVSNSNEFQNNLNCRKALPIVPLRNECHTYSSPHYNFQNISAYSQISPTADEAYQNSANSGNVGYNNVSNSQSGNPFVQPVVTEFYPGDYAFSPMAMPLTTAHPMLYGYCPVQGRSPMGSMQGQSFADIQYYAHQQSVPFTGMFQSPAQGHMASKACAPHHNGFTATMAPLNWLHPQNGQSAQMLQYAHHPHHQSMSFLTSNSEISTHNAPNCRYSSAQTTHRLPIVTQNDLSMEEVNNSTVGSASVPSSSITGRQANHTFIPASSTQQRSNTNAVAYPINDDSAYGTNTD